MRHAGGKPAEHVGDGNAHPADSGSPTALAGFNSDDVLIPSRSLVAAGSCILAKTAGARESRRGWSGQYKFHVHGRMVKVSIDEVEPCSLAA
jgi:hypothetical protein